MSFHEGSCKGGRVSDPFTRRMEGTLASYSQQLGLRDGRRDRLSLCVPSWWLVKGDVIDSCPALQNHWRMAPETTGTAGESGPVKMGQRLNEWANPWNLLVMGKEEPH